MCRAMSLFNTEYLHDALFHLFNGAALAFNLIILKKLTVAAVAGIKWIRISGQSALADRIKWAMPAGPLCSKMWA